MSADTVIQAMEQAIVALKNTWVPDVQEVKAVYALREAIKEYEVEREWIGLTDVEIQEIDEAVWDEKLWDEIRFARAIETKLREKNT